NAALHALEPHLSERAVAAIHWTNSWAVTDPGALVQAYADDFFKRGGTFTQATVKAINHAHGGWHVHTDGDTLHCDELVLATGPWSMEWLKRLGYHIPMFVQRGYH